MSIESFFVTVVGPAALISAGTAFGWMANELRGLRREVTGLSQTLNGGSRCQRHSDAIQHHSEAIKALEGASAHKGE
jgi:hypothetical protein